MRAVPYSVSYLTLCILSCLSFVSAAEPAPPADVWAAAYDPATQTRYLPLELILGAPWNGRHEIAMPRGSFTESVQGNPSTWHGPKEWQHPDTGEKLIIYDRSRNRVTQKFAVRKDGSAIGRVADNRFNINSCDQEAKYPLGYWRQGETRHFEYRCWRTRGGAQQLTGMISTLTIEQIDFLYGFEPHSLQVRWILKHAGEDKEIDNKVYIFSPLKGVVSVQ